MSLHVLIADDEVLARNHLKGMLAGEPDLVVAGEAADGPTAAQFVVRQPVDAVFLDTQMPGVDDFGLQAAFDRRPAPEVVFVTNFDADLIKGFEANAVDYLLKPVTANRLRESLERVRARRRNGAAGENRGLRQVLADLRTRSAQAEQARVRSGPEFLEKIVVKADGASQAIPVGEIEAYEAARNYVRLHTIAGGRHLIRERISYLEQRLDPSRFVRIHRGTVIAINRVKQVEPWFSGDLVVHLQSGAQFRISRNFKDAFKARVGSVG